MGQADLVVMVEADTDFRRVLEPVPVRHILPAAAVPVEAVLGAGTRRRLISLTASSCTRGSCWVTRRIGKAACTSRLVVGSWDAFGCVLGVRDGGELRPGLDRAWVGTKVAFELSLDVLTCVEVDVEGGEFQRPQTVQ